MLIERKKRIQSDIDLTPLIDVVFQLLIFLMISSQFTKPEAQIDLPQTPGPALSQPDEEKTLSIAITANGEISINNEVIPRADFTNTIRSHVAAGTERAKIRGDQEASYGLFVEIMEETRQAGVKSLGIVRQSSDEK